MIHWFSHALGGERRGVIREAIVPGFDAEIPVQIAAFRNKIIIEIGQAGPDEGEDGNELKDVVAELQRGEGDCTQTQTVETRLYGTFNNCYKVSVDIQPVNTTDGGRVDYRIVFKQTVADVVT